MIWATIAWIVYSGLLLFTVTDEDTPAWMKVLIPVATAVQVAVAFAIIHFVTKYW